MLRKLAKLALPCRYSYTIYVQRKSFYQSRCDSITARDYYSLQLLDNKKSALENDIVTSNFDVTMSKAISKYAQRSSIFSPGRKKPLNYTYKVGIDCIRYRYCHGGHKDYQTFFLCWPLPPRTYSILFSLFQVISDAVHNHF